jgi:hypothetical protein
MILLPNVYFDTLRSSYSTSSGTDTVEPYLRRVVGHMSRVNDSPKIPGPASNIRAIYDLHTDVDVDIQRGDVLINICRIATGQAWVIQGDYEEWIILDYVNSSPGFLEYKDITVGWFLAGGPV